MLLEVTKVFAEQRKKGRNDLRRQYDQGGVQKCPRLSPKPVHMSGVGEKRQPLTSGTPSPRHTLAKVLREPEHRQVPQAESSKCSSSDPLWD